MISPKKSNPSRNTLSNWLVTAIAMFVVVSVGCWDSQPKESSSSQPVASSGKADRTLTVLVVENKDLSQELKTQYQGHQEGKIEIQTVDLKSFRQKTQDKSLSADVVIYPAVFMPYLAATDQIRSMTKDRLDSIKYSQWLQYEKKVGSWNKKTWGVSLGSQFRVFISKNKLLHDKKTITFDEIEAEGSRIGWPVSGEAVAESIIDRAAPLARTNTQIDILLNRFNGKSKISSPAFVRALESQDKHKISEKNTPWWNNSNVHTGWMNPFEKRESGSPFGKEWKVLPIAGSKDHYDFFQEKWVSSDTTAARPIVIHPGLVASVNKSSTNERAAWKFLQIFSIKKTADRIVRKLDRPGIFQANQVSRLNSLLSDSLVGSNAGQLEPIYIGLETGAEYFPLILPLVSDWEDRKEHLAKSIQNVFEGKQNPKDALKECNTNWDKLLDQQKELTIKILRNQD